MTERVFHDRALVYGVADQVRHDSSVYANTDRCTLLHVRCKLWCLWWIV